MIDAIAAAISGTAGCSLLDVDPGASTNRTVYTFVGSPDAVVEGALNAARQAFSLIDMSKHSGEQLQQDVIRWCGSTLPPYWLSRMLPAVEALL